MSISIVTNDLCPLNILLVDKTARELILMNKMNETKKFSLSLKKKSSLYNFISLRTGNVIVFVKAHKTELID